MYRIQQMAGWKNAFTAYCTVAGKVEDTYVHILTTGGGEVEECIYCLQVGGDGKNEYTEYRRW